MTKVFTIINKNGTEKSRYFPGDRKLICGFQIPEPGNIRSFISMEELITSISSNKDTNVVKLVRKVNLEDIYISIREVEITEEYLVDDIIPESDFKYKGYRAEFVDEEFYELLYLTNQFPIFLNGNRNIWDLAPKQTDIPHYQLIKRLGIPSRYFDLESICGYLEGNSNFEDELYQESQERLLNLIKIKLFDDYPEWNYRAKRLVKNIDFLTNVKITKNS